MDAMSNKKPLALKLNLQHFGEGDPNPTPNPNPTPTPTPTPAPTPAPTPSGKVWTDEYVTGLRAEAKDHRINAKKYEAHVRTLLGLKPEDELSESMVATFQQNQQKALTDTMKAANNRLLSAEIKSLDGYNAKLVDKLLDRSKVTINEDGTITGLTEAVTELEKEFPEIKVVGSTGGGVNPAGANGGGKTELQQLEEDYKNAPNLATRIAIKNKIFVLQSKQ